MMLLETQEPYCGLPGGCDISRNSLPNKPENIRSIYGDTGVEDNTGLML